MGLTLCKPFMDFNATASIPKGRTIAYARVVVDYRLHKEDPNRVRITAGGNLIDYPGDPTARTANLKITKIMWNSVSYTLEARYMCNAPEPRYNARVRLNTVRYIFGARSVLIFEIKTKSHLKPLSYSERKLQHMHV